MHIEKDYTPGQATLILEVVRGFLCHLSSKMDENGTIFQKN